LGRAYPRGVDYVPLAGKANSRPNSGPGGRRVTKFLHALQVSAPLRNPPYSIRQALRGLATPAANAPRAAPQGERHGSAGQPGRSRSGPVAIARGVVGTT